MTDIEKLEAEVSKLQAEKEKILKKEEQAVHRLQRAENTLKEEQRKARTHRLVERGAILEGFIPEAEKYSNEQIRYILQAAFSRLPYGVKSVHLPQNFEE